MMLLLPKKTNLWIVQESETKVYDDWANQS